MMDNKNDIEKQARYFLKAVLVVGWDTDWGFIVSTKIGKLAR